MSKRRLDASITGENLQPASASRVVVNVSATASKIYSATHKARRVLPAEEALRWTIRDELPKRRDGDENVLSTRSVHPMWTNGLFTRVDNWSREPGMPLAMGDVHPDALKIEAALLGLKAESIDLAPYDIGYRLTGIGAGPNAACEVGRIAAKAAAAVIPWLITFAKRGGMPDFGGGHTLEPALGSRGQVTLWHVVNVECGTGKDGKPWYTQSEQTTTPSRKDTYRPGTFCKIKWTRDSHAIAEDRAHYAAWHAALCLLAEQLARTVSVTDEKGETVERPILDSIVIRPPAAAATPWIVKPAPPRVLAVTEPQPEETEDRSEDGTVVPFRRISVLRPIPRPQEPVRRIEPGEYRPLRRAA